MPATLTQSTWRRHWPAYRLENQSMRVEVAGVLGGKIVAIESRRTGRSWLWSNPFIDPGRPRPGASYVAEHDVGGWDEIMPTVGPCDVPGTPWGADPLADHGVLWSMDWKFRAPRVGGGGEPAAISVQATVEQPSILFQRESGLDPERPELTLTYRLENRGDQPLPFLWAAHPLFPLEPGARITLPPGTVVRCAGALGVDSPVVGEPFQWPDAPRADGGTVDLGRVPSREASAPGRAVKVFTERFLDQDAWVSLTAPDEAETLRIAFRTDEVPHLGLWINDGGWSGAGTAPYHNVGIEPTTSPHDTLLEAIADGTAPTLAPGALRSWTLTLSLTPD